MKLKNAKWSFRENEKLAVQSVWWMSIVFQNHRRKVKSHAVLYYAVYSLFEFWQEIFEMQNSQVRFCFFLEVWLIMLNAKQARSCFRMRETCFYCWMDAFGFEFWQQIWKCKKVSLNEWSSIGFSLLCCCYMFSNDRKNGASLLLSYVALWC
jgi:hypothetical protein